MESIHRDGHGMTDPVAGDAIPPASSGHSDYIVCVDESGDHSLTSIDPDYPSFVLSFCIFRKVEYAQAVTPAIRQLKFATFGHDKDRQQAGHGVEGVSMNRENRTTESRRAPGVPGAQRRPRSRNPFAGDDSGSTMA